MNTEIDKVLDELEDKLISAKEDELILSELNSTLRKKDLIRSAEFSKAQDLAVNQLTKRLSARADEFSNKEILDTISTLQQILGKQDMVSPIPTIAIQNNVVVNEANQLSKESRDKIMSVLSSILNKDEEEDVDGRIISEQSD